MANPTSATFSSCLFQQMENPLEAFGPLAQSCVSEATINFALALGIEPNVQSIEKELRKLKASDHGRAAGEFEYHLCDVIGRKMVIKHARLFKTQFEKTGVITSQEIDTACQSIDKIFSGNGKFSYIPDAKQLLLSETMREIEIIHEPAKQKSLAQKIFSPFSKLYGKSPESTLAENRVHTMSQLKQSINSPMLLTTAPIWGENEEWNDPEPAELDMPLEVGGEFSDSDYELELIQTPSIYPELQRFEIQPIKIGSLYPILSETDALFAPLDRSCVTESPVVTDSGFKHHLRVSYIDLVFADALKNDQKAWDSLPGVVQKDALRHCIYLQSCSGTAEEIACRLFKTTDQFHLQLRMAGLKSFPVKTELSNEFIRKGEKLLQLYYSDGYQKSPLDALDFSTKFNSLPNETLFFQYFYEMAKAAGIQIESWDHNYAENHWKRIDMINLGVQALERCLHTVPQTKGV